MQVNFIGHGLDPKNENTVGNILVTSFGKNKFDSFTGLVAFASYAGVNKTDRSDISADYKFRHKYEKKHKSNIK